MPTLNHAQKAILAPVPAQGRYVSFVIRRKAQVGAALARLASFADGQSVAVGLGLSLIQAVGAEVPGLREFPDFAGAQVPVPSTPVAVWCWLRGTDRGALLHTTRQLEALLAPAFKRVQVVDAFRHGRPSAAHGRDLTGYEDGTENPEDQAAEKAALVSRQGAGMNGSSFVAVLQWQHDLDAFDRMATQAQDHMIGRRRRDNVELDDAPPSAHVKRTTQENFSPPAFVLRRSMPWIDGQRAGLMFVAFGRTLDAFEAQMRRMAGLDDGVTDALFQMSRPVTGAYLWCPPVKDGRLDLRQLGL